MSTNSSRGTDDGDTLSDPMPADAATEAELWTEHRANDSQHARETLFIRFLPLARRIARRTLRLHGIVNIDHDDVYQSAVEGLIQALDRFDQDRGNALKPLPRIEFRGRC